MATNPNEDDLAGWACTQIAAQHLPQTDGEVLGEAIFRSMAPALVRSYVKRWNFLLFSVFQSRAEGGVVLVGVATRLFVIRPAGNTLRSVSQQ